jgi:acyl-CoA synthetase (AMP-forming)/AMP-acid ligase II
MALWPKTPIDEEMPRQMSMYEKSAHSPNTTNTFPSLIRTAASVYNDETAIILKTESRADYAVTFRDLDKRSAEMARGLLARSVGKGTRVGMIFGNGPDFAIAFAAIARIGAVAVPISTLIKSNELVRVLRQSDVSGLLVQRALLGHDYVERLCDALPDLRSCGPDLRLEDAPYLRWIMCTGSDLPSGIQDMASLYEAASSISEEILRAVEAEVHPSDQLVEIYTSGSMALPKGVKHLHGPAVFRIHYLRGILKIDRGSEQTAILPMFWVGGMMLSLLPNWAAGARTLCTESTLSNSQVAMGSVLAEDDLKLLGKKRPYWALGMSETFGPYSYGDVLRAKGYPLCAPLDHIADRFEVRVAGEDGTPASEGETGEIQVRGYALSSGLHKIEREDYYTPDGYFRTGDMGKIEGKRIHFIGRNGDMIKTAGSNVSPAEVELEMQQLNGVHNAYVVGLPDAERGQLVVAAVVPREGAELDFNAIQTTLRTRLSSYKVPRAYVQITRAEVPLLPSNKVARRQIADLMTVRLGRQS